MTAVLSAGMTGAGAQLAALLRLRRQTVRDRRARLALPLAGLVVAVLLVATARVAQVLEPAALATAVEVAPQAFLGFGLLAVVAPLTSGGGLELVPSSQLVAYPVRPATWFAGGLLLAPLNLVWLVQLLVLVAETACLAHGGAALPAALTTAAYVGAVTVGGQAVAWGVVGLRTSPAGRRLVVAAGALLLGGALAVVRLGQGPAVLAHTPTRTVVAAVEAGAGGSGARWALTTLALLLLVMLAGVLGVRACGWALRRSGSGPVRTTRASRRRAPAAGALGQLVATDRRSVWRAPALRRGGLVLGVLPGLLAAGAHVPWSSLVVLPGLVAAGAGLLFGVNAFCLDASGAVWLASLPVAPRLQLQAKALVLLETVGGAVAVAVVCGALGAPVGPAPGELPAVALSALACTLVVVTGGLALSVRRPHRADLAGPRDAVLPPGALVLASLRLALPAALVGALLSAASRTGEPAVAPLVALPVLLLCALSLWRTSRRWADPQARSRVVQAVSAG